MESHSESTKRIAKNTLLLYVRMFVTMLVGLFTSRIVLDALGISDYGLYNVVGGFVSMFSVLTGAMSVATGRYITYSLGLGNIEKLKKTFSTSLNIHILLSVLIIILAETLGLWFLNNKLNIPEARLFVANWVFQFSLITFVLSLINVPYVSCIISHEKMGIYAYFSLFDVFAKLLIVYLLYITAGDKLIVYSVFLMLTNLCNQLIYWYYCKRNFQECKFELSLDRGLFKDMLGFIGWAFLGNAVVILKDQGITVLLNIFLGTVVNAAQGVANQVNSIINRFVGNFMTAVNPQITKYYASGEFDSMNQLIIRSSKFSVYLMLLLMLPVILNIDSILSLWLVSVPPHTNNFVKIILFYSLVECMVTPLITALLASGKIKIYEIILTLIYSANIVLTFVCLKYGCEPEVVYYLLVIFKIMVLLTQISLGKRIFNLSLGPYLKSLFRNILPIIAIAIILIMMPWKFTESMYLNIISSSFVIDSILCILIILIGLDKSEFTFLKNYILKKVFRRI